MVVAIAVGGCSFAFVRAPAQPAWPNDCPGAALPIVDLVAAPVSAVGLVGVTHAALGEEVDAPAAIGAIAIGALPWLASSVFGFVQRIRCTKRMPK